MEGFDERSYLNARRWKPGDDPYTLYAFNQRESERIPSNRALRDTRHYRYTQEMEETPTSKHSSGVTRTDEVLLTVTSHTGFSLWNFSLFSMLW